MVAIGSIRRRPKTLPQNIKRTFGSCQATWRQRRAVNTLAAARQFAAALRASGKIGLDRLSARRQPLLALRSIVSGARSELRRGVVAVTFSPSRRRTE